MNISGILERFGIQNERLIEVINVLFTMLVVSLIGWLAYVVAKKFLPKLIKKIAGATRQHWSEWLLDQRFFNRLALLIMPIVLRTGLSPIKWEHMATINRILDIWIVVAIALLVSAFMSGINRVYEKMASVRDKPVKIITQVITVVIWCAVALIIISIFTRESLAVLLGGLTAFAAVLMLVFQDTILGFVAGIQLSSNNMVRLGDWIVMPSRGVDGEVTEIGLTTVKVQNWDKTISTLPIRKLITDSFKNWRGMYESGGRRIKRSLYIDQRSVRFLEESEIRKLEEFVLLNSYLEGKRRELAEWNARLAAEGAKPINGRRITNLGSFRAYVEQYLRNNHRINQEMLLLVRQLPPGVTGIPLEIYCFTRDVQWIAHEETQSDIFDHLLAILPVFGLRVFQQCSDTSGMVPLPPPSGSDWREFLHPEDSGRSHP